MRLTWRDFVGTLLVAAIVVPFVGYVVNGSMAFIQDARGMASTGLILGWAACIVGGSSRIQAASRAAIALMSVAGLATLGLGVAALWLETNVVVLAAFIAAIVAMWFLTLVRHALGSIRLYAPTSRRAHA